MTRATYPALATLLAAAGAVAPSSMHQPKRTPSPRPELPLSFVAAPRPTGITQFVGRGHGGQLLVSPTEAMLASAGSRQAVRMRVQGANPRAKLRGEAPQQARVNYFVGRDPQQWRTGLPTFGAVRVEETYPGIDLVYYNGGRELEYDFVVQPGADPSQIALAFDAGAERATVAADGRLALTGNAAEIRMGRPVGYQEIEGVRHPVDARFVAAGDEVRFALGSYDESRPLIIDPTVSFSTLLGGTAEDYALAVATDALGRTYVAGRTTSLDLSTANAEQPVFGGGISDAYVARFSADGRTLQTASYFGGLGEDMIHDLAIDDLGDVYLTGATSSSDFPLRNPFQSRFQGGLSDAFVVKLNANLDNLVYGTYLGGAGQDVGEGLALGPSRTAYITGKTGSLNFPITTRAFQRRFGGGTTDAFVTRLAENGQSLRYSTYLGEQGEENFGVATGRIAVDSTGNAYVTGTTGSSRFPITTTAFQRRLGGTHDAFFAKLNEPGEVLLHSTLLGGGSRDYAGDIAVNAEGSAVIVGITESTNFPVTRSAYQQRFGGGGWDMFVTRFGAAKQDVTFSTFLGGRGDEGAVFGTVTDLGAVGFRPTGDIVVAGRTDSFNFPLVSPVQPVRGGFADGFVSRLSDVGAKLLESTVLGGGANDIATDLSIDAGGDVSVVGFTASRDFPLAFPVQSTFAGGLSDAWALRLDYPAPPAPKPALFISHTQLDFGSVRVGLNRIVAVTVRNAGKTNLDGTIGTLSTPFEVVEGSGSFSLAKGKSKTVRIRFAPVAVERSAQELVITSTDPARPVANVPILGRGLAAR